MFEDEAYAAIGCSSFFSSVTTASAICLQEKELIGDLALTSIASTTEDFPGLASNLITRCRGRFTSGKTSSTNSMVASCTEPFVVNFHSAFERDCLAIVLFASSTVSDKVRLLLKYSSFCWSFINSASEKNQRKRYQLHQPDPNSIGACIQSG